MSPQKLCFLESLRSAGAAVAAAALLSVFAVPARAQGHECNTTILDDNSVRVVDRAGNELFRVGATGFPNVQVSPVGPRWFVSDAAGTRILDRTGALMGSLIPNLGSAHSIAFGGDRVVVTDGDKTRIFDLDGNPKGLPINRTGTRRQTVTVAGNRVVVTDDDQVRIYDKDGNQIGQGIPNNGTGRQGVDTKGRRIVVTDDRDTRIFDEHGNQIGGAIGKRGTNRQTVTVDGDRIIITDDFETHIYDDNGARKATIGRSGARRSTIKVCGNRIIFIDDDQVRVFNRDGTAVDRPVPNTGSNRQTVETSSDRIVITDDNKTMVFDKNMSRKFSVNRTGTDRQNVVVDGDRIIITDRTGTQIFDNNGVQQGTDVNRTGSETQRVRVDGDRIVVTDDDQVRVYDRNGNQIGDSIPVGMVEEHGVQLFASVFTITEDFRQVRIFDRDANLQGQPIRVTDGVQHIQVSGDRVVVADDNRVRLFAENGTQIGSAIATRGEPWVTPSCFTVGSFTSFGRGCAGSNGTPRQYAWGDPRIGGDVGYSMTGAAGNGAVSLHLGFSNTSWNGLPLPFDLGVVGAAGCLILNDAPIMLGATADGEGFVSVDLTVPGDSGLVGAAFYTQFVVPDAAANRLGVVVSDSVATRIGEGY